MKKNRSPRLLIKYFPFAPQHANNSHHQSSEKLWNFNQSESLNHILLYKRCYSLFLLSKKDRYWFNCSISLFSKPRFFKRYSIFFLFSFRYWCGNWFINSIFYKIILIFVRQFVASLIATLCSVLHHTYSLYRQLLVLFLDSLTAKATHHSEDWLFSIHLQS